MPSTGAVVPGPPSSLGPEHEYIVINRLKYYKGIIISFGREEINMKIHSNGHELWS